MDARWFGVVWLVAATTGCGSKRSAPGEVIPDPRAYVRQAYVTSPPGWLEVDYYNLDDPALLDGVIDEAVRTRRPKWKGTLPDDKRELDAFVTASRGLYTSAMVDTPERRAQVEAKIRQRFANPPVTRDGDAVVVDLGWVPGRIAPAARAGWRVSESPEIDRHELRKDHVNRAFCLAGTAHPAAEKYEVRVLLHSDGRSSRERLVYRYQPRTDRIAVRLNGDYASRTPVGGVAALCRGEAATHTTELERVRADVD